MAFFRESMAFDALLFLIGICTFICFYLKRARSYWDRKGFKTLPNVDILFGHFKSVFTKQESIADFIKRIYNSTTEPFIGIYTPVGPTLLFRDPELVQTVLVKDFKYFSDRGLHCNESFDPLSGGLVSLPSERWKKMRSLLSPTFTNGKTKAMFSTFVECAKPLHNYLERLAEENKILDIREIAASHLTDVIASVAFGIDVDTINNPNDDFRACGRKIFEPGWNAFRWTLSFIAPKLMTIFRIKLIDDSVERFIKSVVKQNLEYREKNNVVRKDFFQLLIQLRNTGTVQSDDRWETVINTNENQKLLSFDEIAAQTFIFFAAGFETSSTTLSFCMYELAENQDIQQRLHDEIDRVLAKHNGQITYESVAEMKYLDACVNETLRKYPVVPILPRVCQMDYKIPGTKNIIEKGTRVMIPAYAIQMDEKFYENPEVFDPDRFEGDGVVPKSSVNRPYLPFGDGPRNCIGMRMGQAETKVGLISMLRNFRYELDEDTKKRGISYDPTVLILAPLGKINLHVFRR